MWKRLYENLDDISKCDPGVDTCLEVSSMVVILVGMIISVASFTARAETIITAAGTEIKGRVGGFSQNGVKFHADRSYVFELETIRDVKIDSNISAEERVRQQTVIDRLYRLIDKEKYMISDFKQQVQQLLVEKRFDELEKMAEGFLVNKDRFPSGKWKLYYYFTAIKASISKRDIAGYLKRVGLIEQWIGKYPDSAMAKIALMDVYTGLAWAYRGAGYGNTVSKKGKADFRATLEKVIAMGNRLRVKNIKNPHLYRSLIAASNGLGVDRKSLEKLAMESSEIDPLYYPVYFPVMIGLLPRWGGKRGEIERFANRVARLADPETGLEMYFRVIRNIKDTIKDRRYRRFHFDWRKIDKGFQNYQKKYTAHDQDYHLMAKLACLHGEREAAKQYFSLTDGQWNYAAKEIWGKPDFLAQFKRWSNEKPSIGFNKILLAIVSERYPQLAGLLEEYIKLGEDINRTDVYGNSSLHLLIEYNMADFARKVIDEGANVNLYNGDGYSPLHLAARYNRADLIKLLLENAADIKATSKAYGDTSVHIAAKNSFKDALNILLDKDPTLINSLNRKSYTPLHLAAYEGHIDVVKALLARSELALNLKNNSGSTPLNLAVLQGHINIVRLLVENGADPDIKNKNNYTPLSLAKSQKFDDIAEYLKSVGAEDGHDFVSMEDRKKANKLYTEGAKYFTSRDFKKAQKLFAEAIEYDPNNYLYYNGLGLLYWQFEHDLGKADEYMNKSIALNPNFAESYYNLGRINYELGRPAVYQPLFQKYVKLAPDTYNAKELKENYAHLFVDDAAKGIQYSPTPVSSSLISKYRNALLSLVAILVAFLLGKAVFRKAS